MTIVLVEFVEFSIFQTVIFGLNVKRKNSWKVTITLDFFEQISLADRKGHVISRLIRVRDNFMSVECDYLLCNFVHLNYRALVSFLVPRYTFKRYPRMILFHFTSN